MDMYLTALSEAQGTLKRLRARGRRRMALELPRLITQRCGTLWLPPEAPIREFATTFEAMSDKPLH
jgi:hypothetical protein